MLSIKLLTEVSRHVFGIWLSIICLSVCAVTVKLCGTCNYRAMTYNVNVT